LRLHWEARDVPITLVTHDWLDRDLFVGNLHVTEEMAKVKLRATILDMWKSHRQPRLVSLIPSNITSASQ